MSLRTANSIFLTKHLDFPEYVTIVQCMEATSI